MQKEEFAKFDKVTQGTAESFMHDFEISGKSTWKNLQGRKL